MKPTAALKAVSQLLDLPIQDCEGRWCGVVDDVEFGGSPGKDAPMKALLVGPGAYAGRMPRWLFAISRLVAGAAVVRVPIDQVETIANSVQLKSKASELGLARGDAAAGRWIPRRGAL